MLYLGLRAIAKRLGRKSPSTVLKLQERQGFLMYPQSTRNGFQWVTSDDLIFAWELRLSEEAVKWRKNKIKPPFRNEQGRKTDSANGTGAKTKPR